MGRKRKAEKSERLGLTIPAELKRKIDSVKESVNWSAVAAKAFRAFLEGTPLTVETYSPSATVRWDGGE